jgi:hypothetical protein
MGLLRSSFRIRDTQSGFRAYNDVAISSLADSEALGDHMDASTDILYRANQDDLRLEEIGTTVSYAVEHANSKHPFRHGLVLVSNIFRTVYRNHPVLSLGVPGVVLLLVGFALTHWTITDYLTTGTISTVLGLIAVLGVFVGGLACFTSIILHSLMIHVSETGA